VYLINFFWKTIKCPNTLKMVSKSPHKCLRGRVTQNLIFDSIMLSTHVLFYNIIIITIINLCYCELGINMHYQMIEMNLLWPVTLFQLRIDEQFCSTVKRSRIYFCLYRRIRKQKILVSKFVGTYVVMVIYKYFTFNL